MPPSIAGRIRSANGILHSVKQEKDKRTTVDPKEATPTDSRSRARQVLEDAAAAPVVANRPTQGGSQPFYEAAQGWGYTADPKMAKLDENGNPISSRKNYGRKN